VAMLIGSLCFDLLLIYFANKARVRSYFNQRILPRLLFWKERRNRVGHVPSSQCGSAWDKVSRNSRFKLASPCHQSTSLKLTAIQGSHEKSQKRENTLCQKDLENHEDKKVVLSAKNPFLDHVDQASTVSLLPVQTQIFIRVRTLPDNLN
jgi:hypothetical protein